MALDRIARALAFVLPRPLRRGFHVFGIVQEIFMKIAVSSCLLGEPCRYDGKAKPCPSVIDALSAHEVVSICPEVAGGLPTPRLPNEIVTADRAVRVVDREGVDNTDAFIRGASSCVERALREGCSLAILKEKSPSCGCGAVYDGTFTGKLVEGFGLTARRFLSSGVRVAGESVVSACVAETLRLHPGSAPALFAASSADCHAIETPRLVLRPLTSADVEDVFAYCSDPDIGFDAGWDPHRTLEDARFFVEQVASTPHVFGVFEKRAPLGEDTASPSSPARAETPGAGGSRCSESRVLADVAPHGPCIGSVGLIPDPHRSNADCLMLGYALAKRAWGRGYMTEAARAVLDYGFGELGLSLVTCTHFSFNARSKRVIEKCGFSHEGTLRACERTPDGVLRDIETYVLTREDADRFASDPRHAADGSCDAAGENIGRAELLPRGYNNG